MIWRLTRSVGSTVAAAPVEPTELVKRQIIDKLNRMAAKSLPAGAPSP